MKPKNIFIIRHGESEGNVNKAIYSEKPDYALMLTPKGIKQAEEIGEKLSAYHQFTFGVYYSSYFRARQTMEIAIENLKSAYIEFKREDPRLREQEWAGNIPKEGYSQDMEKERDDFGHFYYRFKNAESCADVYNRASDFLSTLNRDFEKEDFPNNVLIFAHGMFNRIFLMRFLHLTVEQFETIKNPKNGEIWHLRLTDAGKYELVTELERFEVKHKWKYNYKQK